MARTETVIGATALSASLAAGTGLVQLEQLGGFQTHATGSYLVPITGTRLTSSIVDSREFRLTWET